MKFCQNHWNLLRKAIEDRGMEHLVAKSGEECVQKLVDDIEQPNKSTFDPLMGSHNMILFRALRDYGLEIMMQNEDGSDRCPICFLDSKHKEKCVAPGCTWSYEKRCFHGVADDDFI